MSFRESLDRYRLAHRNLKESYCTQSDEARAREIRKLAYRVLSKAVLKIEDDGITPKQGIELTAITVTQVLKLKVSGKITQHLVAQAVRHYADFEHSKEDGASMVWKGKSYRIRAFCFPKLWAALVSLVESDSYVEYQFGERIHFNPSVYPRNGLGRTENLVEYVKSGEWIQRKKAE